MANIIKVVVEPAPEGKFLVEPKPNPNNSCYPPVDLIPIHRRVRMFDSDGNMSFRYYTSEEWDDEEESRHDMRFVAHFERLLLTGYLNYILADETVSDFIDELDKGYLPFDNKDLTPSAKELVDALRQWDALSPFEFGNLHVEHHTYVDESDGKTYYCIDYFDKKKK